MILLFLFFHEKRSLIILTDLIKNLGQQLFLFSVLRSVKCLIAYIVWEDNWGTWLGSFLNNFPFSTSILYPIILPLPIYESPFPSVTQWIPPSLTNFILIMSRHRNPIVFYEYVGPSNRWAIACFASLCSGNLFSIIECNLVYFGPDVDVSNALNKVKKICRWRPLLQV